MVCMPENFYYRPPATVTEVLALLVVEANKVNCICKHGVLNAYKMKAKFSLVNAFPRGNVTVVEHQTQKSDNKQPHLVISI